MGTLYYISNFSVGLKVFQNEKFKIIYQVHKEVQWKVSYHPMSLGHPDPFPTGVSVISVLCFLPATNLDCVSVV